jgi:hypothetical protein
MKRSRNRSLSAWYLAVFLTLFAPSARGGGAEWFAGIDVGAKGIKVIALPIDEAGKPDLHQLVKDLPGRHHQAVNNVTLKDLKDGKFRPEAIAEAQAAIKDFYEQLTRRGVPNGTTIKPENIWIVASSGLLKGRPSNLGELEQAVRAATGGAKALEPIPQKREVELLMRGAIPKEFLEDSVLVDVGSGNVKGGYFHPRRGPHVERFYVLDVELDGTEAYRQRIEKEMREENVGSGFGRFWKIAERRRNQLVEDVAEEIGRKPGLVSSARRRVYLSGGAPYVIASLLHPLEMARDDVLEVRFTVEELHNFIRKFQKTERIPVPPLDGLSGRDREDAEAKVREVLDIFEPRSLLAGAEILLAFNEALHWEEDKKDVYFTKSGLVAWIVGYVAESRTGAVRTRNEP